MSSAPCPCKDDIRLKAQQLGAIACGFAEATAVTTEAQAIYRRWIDGGNNANMAYCAKYSEQRDDPRLLLDGARTVIVCAFNYYNTENDLPLAPYVARYAWGNDYHWVVKQRLKVLGDYVKERYGGEYRVCVDTAPVRERYWAQRSGIGYVGLNGQLIVPGTGSYVFLGELLWTGIATADDPCTDTCAGCGACINACPNRALAGDGSLDARRCISYLTIEHRGDIDAGLDLHGQVYGCDICQRVCPHNREAHDTEIAEFKPDREVMSLYLSDFQAMTRSHFRRLTRKSAMQRVDLEQFLRNIEKLK